MKLMKIILALFLVGQSNGQSNGRPTTGTNPSPAPMNGR